MKLKITELIRFFISELFVLFPLIVGGLINRGIESPLDICNLGGGNKLKWVDICETSLNGGGYLIDLVS